LVDIVKTQNKYDGTAYHPNNISANKTSLCIESSDSFISTLNDTITLCTIKILQYSTN